MAMLNNQRVNLDHDHDEENGDLTIINGDLMVIIWLKNG